jgi:homoserine O-acetyltransferase
MDCNSLHKCCVKEEFKLELGGSLPELQIFYEQWGPENGPVVMIMPSLSSSSHARTSVSDPTPGWWEGIDTNKYRVICASILGSPFGTTSPVSINPLTGQKYGKNFPVITTSDQARVHKLLLDRLGITKLHGLVGASLGGMQVLKFASLFPDSVERIISISATGKTTPGTVALRRVQRAAIILDPKFQNGEYYPSPGPIDGLKIARELGTITYRSRDEFNERFDWNPQKNITSYYEPIFEVEKYLQAKGEKFTYVYDANCYLLLSRCMDMMDLGSGFPSYYDGVSRIKAKSFLIGVDRDMLIPVTEQQHLYFLLKELGRDVRFEVVSSLFGHDAFLKEHEWFNPRLKQFLEDKIPHNVGHHGKHGASVTPK